MLKTSTMKPFARGDIFLGCSYLNDPDDDHKGEGRILQFDKNWIPKGTLYTEGTTYLIVGCNFGPDGTLWGFDSQGHTVVRVSPDGKQLENWKPGRGFGSVSWDAAGNLYFGEYFIGREIWKGTTAAKRPDGTLGDGNIYKYSPDLKLLQTFVVENAPEFTHFKGVTHSTMHPSKQFITYTTETARRLMRYDIVNDRQMADLDSYPEADPEDTICMTVACCVLHRTDCVFMTKQAKCCRRSVCPVMAGHRFVRTWINVMHWLQIYGMALRYASISTGARFCKRWIQDLQHRSGHWPDSLYTAARQTCCSNN
jgi:hypothetical protein